MSPEDLHGIMLRHPLDQTERLGSPRSITLIGRSSHARAGHEGLERVIIYICAVGGSATSRLPRRLGG